MVNIPVIVHDVAYHIREREEYGAVQTTNNPFLTRVDVFSSLVLVIEFKDSGNSASNPIDGASSEPTLNPDLDLLLQPASEGSCCCFVSAVVPLAVAEEEWDRIRTRCGMQKEVDIAGSGLSGCLPDRGSEHILYFPNVCNLSIVSNANQHELQNHNLQQGLDDRAFARRSIALERDHRGVMGRFMVELPKNMAITIEAVDLCACLL